MTHGPWSIMVGLIDCTYQSNATQYLVIQHIWAILSSYVMHTNTLFEFEIGRVWIRVQHVRWLDLHNHWPFNVGIQINDKPCSSSKMLMCVQSCDLQHIVDELVELNQVRIIKSLEINSLDISKFGFAKFLIRSTCIKILVCRKNCGQPHLPKSINPRLL